MHRLVLPLVGALLLAGCSAQGQTDPFAYTKKPLYAGGFDLAKLDGASERQEFRVSDGSIPAVQLNVWINATAGGASVIIRDPAGHVALETSETTSRAVGLNLGAWTVDVQGQPASAGIVHVLATRG
ncbi:MAG TPA: hypothetical protein VM370_02005 [Candidatus Thermoplasmatota archaeon]|nr:hypothetical protein [Candidatus Thermoplasmatota archaeon]